MRRSEPLALLVLGLICLGISRLGALESGTWLLEVFPIFIAVPILVATARRFPLTPLAYRLIFVHALILMVGGHYTYAKVPLGFWMEHALHLTRNNYDRIGHFAQGFVPAIIAREILLRRSPLSAWQVALLSGHLRLSRDQRLLRIHRMGHRGHRRFFSRRIPRYAGRRVGHPVGHVHGADRCDRVAAAARPRPRPATSRSRGGSAPHTRRSARHGRRLRME